MEQGQHGIGGLISINAVARKMSDKVSLQLVPSLIYLNKVPYGINNSNFVWSIGAAGK